jgi:hypothetical protein
MPASMLHVSSSALSLGQSRVGGGRRGDSTQQMSEFGGCGSTVAHVPGAEELITVAGGHYDDRQRWNHDEHTAAGNLDPTKGTLIQS